MPVIKRIKKARKTVGEMGVEKKDSFPLLSDEKMTMMMR